MTAVDALLIVKVVLLSREQSGCLCIWCNVRLDFDTGEVNMSALGFVLLPGHSQKWSLNIIVHHCSKYKEGGGRERGKGRGGRREQEINEVTVKSTGTSYLR